jgi:hypothetical protein
MALERPDIKMHFDERDHDALKVFADLDGKTLKRYCEEIITAHLMKRIGDTNLAHAQLSRLGIDGDSRASLGKP